MYKLKLYLEGGPGAAEEAAICALEWLLLEVDGDDVLLHVSLLAEAPMAVAARERLLLLVHRPHVLLQQRLRRAAVRALRARERTVLK